MLSNLVFRRLCIRALNIEKLLLKKLVKIKNFLFNFCSQNNKLYLKKMKRKFEMKIKKLFFTTK